ncbi:MAG TPA: hypothetical protein VGX92_13225 [Pyrinomonadaceae bacterium]|jgi:hypothetical protein|nr:hypothetical protein [Pyrinomonadaceae bacterium]
MLGPLPVFGTIGPDLQGTSGSVMEYVAFIFALALACTAGMEFVYLRFMEAINRQQKRRIAELERQNAELQRELRNIETALEQEGETDEEMWPELLDDDSPG